MDLTMLLVKARKLAKTARFDERGAIAIEYVLIALIVAVGIIIALVVFRDALIAAFQALAQAVMSQ